MVWRGLETLTSQQIVCELYRGDCIFQRILPSTPCGHDNATHTLFRNKPIDYSSTYSQGISLSKIMQMCSHVNLVLHHIFHAQLAQWLCICIQFTLPRSPKKWAMVEDVNSDFHHHSRSKMVGAVGVGGRRKLLLPPPMQPATTLFVSGMASLLRCYRARHGWGKLMSY